MATVAHPRLDTAEFLALQGSAGWRLGVELIAGEAVVIPPAGGHAASAQGELFFALRRWQETSADTGLLLQDVFVRLSEGHYLAPDIAWWAAERRPPLSHGAISVVPDLVVEVLSPATRLNDLGIKRDLYLSAGVRELWLADPEAKTISVARPDAGDEPLGTGQRLTSPLLPRLALDVGAMFVA